MPDYKSKYTGAQIDAFFDELVEARGSRGRLGYRLDNISNFASPNSGGNIVGRYYDIAFHAATVTNYTTAADRLDISPFYMSQPFKMDSIGVNVTTAAAAGGLARIVMYSSTLEGWPQSLVFTGADLAIDVTGLREQAVNFTIDAGRQYWIGLHMSVAAAVMSGIPTSSLTNLGLPSGATSTGASYCSALRRTQAFSGGAPTDWGSVVSAQFVASVAPSIRMRYAAAA